MLTSFLAQYADSLPALSPEQVVALEAHLALLERWNRTINLTSVIRKNEATAKHLGESLFLAAHLPPGPLRICDIGSGGGFPGVPVAIARPDCTVMLVESDVRKGVFLRETSRKLPGVSVKTARFEAVTGDFDWLISRAVNLAKTSGGPKANNMAFLGAAVIDKGPKRSLASAYRWRSLPVPWDPSSFLHLGECFT